MSGYRRMGRQRTRPRQLVWYDDQALRGQRAEYRDQRRQRRAFRKIRKGAQR